MKEYSVAGHVYSYLPEEKNWKLVWSDEFDGTALNEDNWEFRTYFWGKKSPTFTDEVFLDGESNLHLPLIERDGEYYSAQLQTASLTYDLPKDSEKFWPFGSYHKPKFMHKFGYYECRCKLPKNDGWHAAFWLQSPSIGAHPNPEYAGVEIDVMENYLQATKNEIICGIGYNGYGKDSVWPGHFHFPYEETADGWHTYAVDWSEDGYIFYADGKEIGRRMKPDVPVSQVEEFILVTTECHGYNRVFSNTSTTAGAAGDSLVWHGHAVPVLKNAVLPDEFVVDYVRVFDEVKTEE